MNCIFSIPSLLHHFLSFRSSVLPLSFQSEVLFILLSPQSLLSFLHYTRCLLSLCSPLHYFPLCCSNPSPSFLHLSSPPPRHRPLLHLLLPLFLCCCFFTSSFASFLRYISFPSLHPSLPSSTGEQSAWWKTPEGKEEAMEGRKQLGGG